MSAERTTILIFEPQAGGHRENFIRLLTDGIRQLPATKAQFVFFTATDAETACPGISAQLAAAGRFSKQRLLWKLFCQAYEKIKPDHVLILELTQLELPLALSGSPCPVSAILFVQYPELPRGLKFFLKEWKTALLLRRAPVRNLFLLNGEESCRYLTGRFGSRSRFIPVPDPVPEITAEPGYSLHSEYRIPADRTVFLFFGSFSPRKGADVLIQALEILPAAAAAQSAFIFCGKPEPRYRDTFEKACARLRSARPGVMLNVTSRFVSDEQMMAMFEQSDMVLMPYTRPEYSSGILALAAKARTPVIGPGTGLLGRLIRENGLGTTCTVTAGSVAEAIAGAVAKRPGVAEKRCAAFVEKSCPSGFSRVILNTLEP